MRASAASIGQTLTTQEVNARVEMLGAAAEHPQVIAARQSADCSAELHRAAVLLELLLGLPAGAALDEVEVIGCAFVLGLGMRSVVADDVSVQMTTARGRRCRFRVRAAALTAAMDDEAVQVLVAPAESRLKSIFWRLHRFGCVRVSSGRVAIRHRRVDLVSSSRSPPVEATPRE